MKNNRGITLILVILYVLLTIIILGVLTILSTNFRKNLNNMNSQTVQDIEFDKLNVQLIKETKDETNKIKTAETTESKLVFKNGNTYEFILEDNAVYLNNSIKIADNIENCTFEVEETKSTNRKVEKETVQYTDKSGKIAVIPKGYAVSGKENEQLIDNGLVIYYHLQDTKQRLIVKVTINGAERISEYALSNNGEIDWNNDEEYLEAKKTYNRFKWISMDNKTYTNIENTDDIYICKNKTTSIGECKVSVVDGKVTCTTHSNCTSMLGRWEKNNETDT